MKSCAVIGRLETAKVERRVDVHSVVADLDRGHPIGMRQKEIAQALVSSCVRDNPEVAALDADRWRRLAVGRGSGDGPLTATGEHGLDRRRGQRWLIAEQDDRGLGLCRECLEPELQRDAHPSLRMGVADPRDGLVRVGWETQPTRDNGEDRVQPCRDRELKHVLQHCPVPDPRQLLWRSETT